jgi:hypothetical protein
MNVNLMLAITLPLVMFLGGYVVFLNTDVIDKKSGNLEFFKLHSVIQEIIEVVYSLRQ